MEHTFQYVVYISTGDTKIVHVFFAGQLVYLLWSGCGVCTSGDSDFQNWIKKCHFHTIHTLSIKLKILYNKAVVATLLTETCSHSELENSSCHDHGGLGWVTWYHQLKVVGFYLLLSSKLMRLKSVDSMKGLLHGIWIGHAGHFSFRHKSTSKEILGNIFLVQKEALGALMLPTSHVNFVVIRTLKSSKICNIYILDQIQCVKSVFKEFVQFYYCF